MGRAGLFLSPGLGKTAISLTIIQECLSERNPWLVLCPLRVMDTWEQEIKAWKHLSGLRSVRLHGKYKVDVLHEQADLYLMNYEGLPWLHELLVRNKGKDSPFHNIILDESQRMKAHNTKRWKKFRSMVPMFDRRLLLTGTPLGGGGVEGLFTQTYILDRGRTFGHNFTDFQYRYFNPSPHCEYSWVLREGALDEIWKQIDPFCLSMRAIDKLDMPELIRNNIYVDLPRDAAAMYYQVKEDFFLQLDDNTVVLPPTAAATLMKLRQISQGGVFDEEGIWHRLHDAKVEALIDLVDELNGTPLIVFYQFNGELERLREVFPAAPAYRGGLSQKEATQIKSDFNSDKIPVLFAHPKAASLGLNLQEGSAHNICWFTPTYSLEEFIQSEARLWRQGQDRGVVVHHILSRGTVDHAIMAALEAKDGTQQFLIKQLLLDKEEAYV